MNTQQVEALYAQVTGRKVEEAINSIPNLMLSMKRVSTVEVNKFIVEQLASGLPAFGEHFENPLHPEFKVVLKDLVERYQIMASDERIDLFEKISIMFKEIFQPFDSLGAGTADAIAESYAKQMCDAIKQVGMIQTTELGIPKIDFSKV
jgi:hypothetical protein